jgi:hypothetical protein
MWPKTIRAKRVSIVSGLFRILVWKLACDFFEFGIPFGEFTAQNVMPQKKFAIIC